MDPVAATSRWTAAARARESARADALFSDPLADLLAGPEGWASLEAEPLEAQGNPYLAIRTRYFDDWLNERIAAGLRQVVLVAAGMDTRAFRLGWPAELTCWELDRPALLELKAALLADAGAPAATCTRRTLGVDLATDSWPAQLRAAGFRATEPSVWLAEGVLEYFNGLAAVERLLRCMAELAAPGSWLGTDILSEDFLRSPWMASYLERLRQIGAPWQFGTNQPEALLERCGWQAESVRQPGEPGASYDRWPWPVAPREVPGFPRSFLVTARRAEAAS
jgi:methyltransferase (TIGR00027 family)